MKKLIFSIILVLIIIVGYNCVTYANLEPISNLEELADYMKTEDDDGIKVENFRLNHGNMNQIGYFKDAEKSKTNIEGFDNIDSGIFLTTGTIEEEIFQANTYHPYPSYTNNADGWTPGNPVEGKTFDPIYLEFDATSETDTIGFQYVFASEEFDQSPIFNDKMYIMYKKDGDSAYTRVNINPFYTGDDDEDEEVKKYESDDSSLSINGIRNTKYHYDNINGQYFTYLGYTPLLSCKIKVEPNEKYNIIIGLIDVGDPIYDSGILLKANSFTSDDPPPSEENPNPSTRELIEAKNEISAVKVTLATGESIILAEVVKDENNNPVLTPDSHGAQLLVNKVGSKTVHDITGIADTLVINSGAVIEVEYIITATNTGVENYVKFYIEDKMDEKYTFYKDSSLLTENGKNSDYNWEKVDNETIKLEDTSGIAPGETKTKKIVYTRQLGGFAADFDPFKNSAKAIFVDSRDVGLRKTLKAGEVLIIPPTGKQDEIIYIVIAFLIITIGIIIYIKRR